MDAKFATNVFNEMLLNVAKSQGYSFCVCVCWGWGMGGGVGGTKRVFLLVISPPMKLINGYNIARFWWQQSEAHIIE